MKSLNGFTDDLIKLHESMVNVNTEAHSALSKAVQQAYDGLARQADFAAAVEIFHQQLLRDLDTSGVEFRSYFAQAVNSMGNFTQSIIDRLTSAVKDIENDIAGLDEVSPSNTVLVAWLKIRRTFTKLRSRFSTYKRTLVACSDRL